MKRIFITGGTGFFGKSMLDYRLRHPEVAADEWTILSRDPGKFMKRYPRLAKQAGVRFRQGDVRTFAFGDKPYDAVIHAATEAVTTLSDDEMTSVIVDGTRHVIDFAKACGAQKLMLTSSGAVYGALTTQVSEETACSPTTAYGKGKLLAETLCRESGLHVLLPRCFAFVGPYLSRGIHFAIGNFIQNCLDGQPIVIKGDGSPMRSYLYADDLVEWLFAILERGESGRPYNVGSDEAVSIRDLALLVRDTLQSNNQTIKQSNNQTILPVQVLGQSVAGAANYYVPNVERARRELGLVVKVGLKEAIARSV